MKKTVLLLILILVCALTFGLAACGEGGDLQAPVDSSQGSVDGGDSAACEHQWQAATCLTPKTCSLCGETEGEALGHQWQNATCLAPKTCSLCGETEGEALEHVFAEYTIVDPTCTQEGTKTGECTLCHSVETLDTYKALGHRLIHGNCTRCGADQNNVFVAIEKNDSYGISEKISQAWTYYSAAIKIVRNDERKFDSYYTYMLRELSDMENYSSFAQYRWTTEEYSYPVTAYEEMRAGLTALKESSEYQTYMKYKGKDYDSAYALAARLNVSRSTYDYLERINDQLEALQNYFIEIMKKPEYLDLIAATPEDVICYASGNAEDSGFRISCNSDLRIVLDSFNKTSMARAYIAEITDGEHTYTETVETESAGPHSFTFTNCILNEGSKVTLSFYSGDETPVAQFDLLAVAAQTETADDTETETADDPESLDNALVGFAS